jgi:hypothetical protein
MRMGIVKKLCWAIACSVGLGCSVAVAQNSLYVDSSGFVGVGTDTPTTNLNVMDNTGTTAARPLLLLSNLGPVGFNMENRATSDIWRFAAQTTGFRISLGGSGGPEFEVGNDGTLLVGPGATTNLILDASGNLDITGTLTTAGSCSFGCDAVFKPGYDLPTIEEHARLMWRNAYLPAVGSTIEGQPFNLSHKTGGILNELEKAHIYIEQLNNRLVEKENQLDQVNRNLAELAEELTFLKNRNQTEETRLDARLELMERAILSITNTPRDQVVSATYVQ